MFHPHPRSCRSGFTLVELLVAMAILTIIVAALGTIMGTASSLTTTNDNHIDADGRARTVFDRMANDFAQMVKRNDVDFIFFKATGNDAMFFYTEGASYYDGATPLGPDYKNRVSLVGYRINQGAAGTPTYGQMERLGKALMWDLGGGTNPSMVFLNYAAPTSGGTCAAYPLSTLAGSYSTSSAVGTADGNFSDSKDTSYHPLASNVFRFEYSYQLKDGTQSNMPVMQKASAQNANGVFSSTTASAPPTSSDGSPMYAAGSRWYDTTDQIGYICADPTAGLAVWHEIGIQDISAVVVTIAVMGDQGMVFVKNANISLPTVAQQFEDSPDPSTDADPARDIVTSWTSAITPPAGGGKSAVSTATNIPQTMVSQIRIYQRFFYINNT